MSHPPNLLAPHYRPYMFLTLLANRTSIRQVEERSRTNSLVRPMASQSYSTSSLPGSVILLEIDTGGRDEEVRQWPSCVRISNGKAFIQATIRQPDDENYDIEAQLPRPAASRTKSP